MNFQKIWIVGSLMVSETGVRCQGADAAIDSLSSFNTDAVTEKV